ncbi:DUF4747 family protein [Leeia aquatica]|uniref:DUF4747 family protein n=1 Tax=Leeia aquatica TaxID=2725557 RepID=A0A847RUP8_9NEIS|nr:DUF4747 family protein [Leeia aquatica]NLR73561.1 DUF4747 family protein [Leeia aquatica]
MARDRTVEIGGINIVTHPHAPAGYVRLLYAAFELRQSIRIRKDQHLMLGEIRAIDGEKPENGLIGKLYRFVNIDKDAPWLNIKSQVVATEEERARIHIPENLRPNLEQFGFVFYPHGHTFYFESNSFKKSLSPRQVFKLLDILFSHPDIVAEFGPVDVTILPDRDQLENILKMPTLRKLTIVVQKPNADELGDAEKRVFDRMRSQNARRTTLEITAELRQSLELDEDIRELARVAASNGKVHGSGFGIGGERLEESTVAKPWLEKISYNPDLQLPDEALIAATERRPGHGD